jgi:hemerythrin-like domain-containing protein
MKPTEELKKEHEAIKLMIRIMGSISERLESGKKVDPKHLESILEFIRVFADKCHHAKEEDLLFPAMEKVGIPREGGPVGVMLHEHEEGRGYVKAMGEGIAQYAKGESKGASKIAENARNYMALLSQHIDKENNILYPMADKRISEAGQKELEEGFEKVEREIVGPGRHEEFHRLLHSLKEEYVKE